MSQFALQLHAFAVLLAAAVLAAALQAGMVLFYWG